MAQGDDASLHVSGGFSLLHENAVAQLQADSRLHELVRSMHEPDARLANPENVTAMTASVR